MNDFYYVIEDNGDGFVLHFFSSSEGYIDTVDACPYGDQQTLDDWRVNYDAVIDRFPNARA